MATVNFLYRSTKDKANLHLRLLYRYNDIDYIFGANTKLEVSKDYWQKQHKKKSKDINITNKQVDINRELNNLENHILKSFNSVNPDEVTKEWLKSEINLYYNPPKETSSLPNELLKYFEHFINEKSNDLANSTVKKYNTVYKLLERYEKKLKRKLMIKDVDLSFKKSFEDYCLDNNYAPNTIARAIRAIKTVCNHARYNGIETSYQLEKIKTKYSKIENIYLTEDDIDKLKKIKKKKLTVQLENVRDWLIISCYTGQRISDFMRFNKKMLRQETIKNGKLVTLIEFTQKKTGKVMVIPLTQEVLDILEKRDGEFPSVISDQKYNEYIKKVGFIAKLNEKVIGSKKLETAPKSGKYRKVTKEFEKWELISSHIGRRSFSTNNYGVIPTYILMNITGHSTESMFLTYIGKSSKDIAMELTNYF